MVHIYNLWLVPVAKYQLVLSTAGATVAVVSECGVTPAVKNTSGCARRGAKIAHMDPRMTNIGFKNNKQII